MIKVTRTLANVKQTTMAAIILLLSAPGAVALACEGGSTECPDPQPWTDYAVCVEKPLNTNTFVEWEGTLTNHDKENVTSTVKSTANGAEVEIVCSKTKIKNAVGDSGASTGEIWLTGCTVNKPASCKMEEALTVLKYNGNLSVPPAAISDTLTGEGANESFGDFKLANNGGNCVAKGTRPLEGKQICEFDNAIGVKNEHHELICKKTGSQLKLNGETATYTTKVEEYEPETVLDGELENWLISKS